MTKIIKPAVHGGNLQQAAELYGVKSDDFLDFSANISWLGPPPGINEAIERGISVMQHYPDPKSRNLVQAIAHATNLPPDHILVGNGSIELIYALLRGLGQQRALVAEPTFNEYARAVQLVGGEVTSFQLLAEQDWKVDLKSVAERLENVDLVFLCNPNNPTGQLLPKRELVWFIEEAKKHGTMVIVDEAFLDFVEDFADCTYSVLDLVTFVDNLVVLRSFTKFFAIPGLRLGFCVASPSLIRLISANQEPWTVNCIAQSVGELLVADILAPFRKQVRQKIQESRDQMVTALTEKCRIRSWGQVNYLFLDLGVGVDGAALTSALGYQGLLVRDCNSFGKRFGHYLRVAVRSPEENSHLVRILELVLREARR